MKELIEQTRSHGRIREITLVILALTAYACTESVPKASEVSIVVNSSDFNTIQSRTAGIQEAVDALPQEGGVVYIPLGNHQISRAIHLRSGVYIRGEGNHTVVSRRWEVFHTPLAQPALEGATTVEVEDSSGFVPGDEICLQSKESYGWWSLHTIITDISNNVVTLEDELTHDYLPEEKAQVLNLFPAFHAEDSKDIRIENLSIDGGLTDEDRKNVPVEFTLSAVHFRAVDDCVVSGLLVKNYPGDGISIQSGDNATVSNCLSEYNLGHGFHPGTGLSSGAWTNNIGRHNGWDGLFFCHRVRHTIISGNRFHDNGWNGIGSLGIGGEGGDRYNVVSGNFCYNNAKSGIECRGGGNNTVSNNVCENNSQGDPGRWPGILVVDTHNTIISGNRCLDYQEPASSKTQGYGILVEGSSHDNIITGNIITGHSQDGIYGDALSRSIVRENIVKKTHEPAGI